MTEPQSDFGTRQSALALGGALMGAFALVVSGGLFGLSVIAPSPFVLLWPVLMFPFAVAAAVMGFVGRRRALAEGIAGARAGVIALVLAGVTLVGVLPLALGSGIPRFRAFQLENRENEAKHNLSRIRMGAVSARLNSSTLGFPQGDSGWTPARPPSTERYRIGEGDWSDEPWASLDFTPSTAHFFQYRYRALGPGQGVVLLARGDLDGDGEMVTFTSTLSPDGTLVGPVHRSSENVR